MPIPRSLVEQQLHEHTDAATASILLDEVKMKEEITLPRLAQLYSNIRNADKRKQGQCCICADFATHIS